MSMNLAFRTRKGRYPVEFPFQTATDLTYKVLGWNSTREDTPCIDEQIKMIFNTIDSWKWDEDITNQWKENVLDLMTDPNLELTYE